MKQYPELSREINQQLVKIQEYKLDLWNEFVFLDWHWWFGVIVSILSIAAWWWFHDRSDRMELLLAGFTTAICAATLDTAGHFLGLFDYHYDVIPLIPNYIPWDFLFIPVLVIFAIQLFPTVSIIVKGLVLSALIAFAGLPVLSAMGIYQLINWNYLYSFVLIFLIFMAAYGVSRVQNRNPL
ncbi:CBO0543 family protein [Salibacterium sp. K-3]